MSKKKDSEAMTASVCPEKELLKLKKQRAGSGITS
jgi:hypothetical protein